MKKIFLSVMSHCAIFIFLAVGITGCKKKSEKESNLNVKDVYAISALSSVNYLQYLESTTSTANLLSRPEQFSDENIKGIKDCLELFDGVIGDKISQTTSKNTNNDEAYSNYNFVMVISVPGLNDFIMYYNELETKTLREIKDENEEIEVSTTLSGIMVVGDSRYEVKGKREFEQENDEVESSIEFTTYSSTNRNNYVVVSQSIENENNNQEIEYEYKIYVNGAKVQDLEIEMEMENGKTELKFKLKDLSSGIPSNTIYKIKRSTDANTFVVECLSNNIFDTINVKKVGNDYIVKYSHNFEETI